MQGYTTRGQQRLPAETQKITWSQPPLLGRNPPLFNPLDKRAATRSFLFCNFFIEKQPCAHL